MIITEKVELKVFQQSYVDRLFRTVSSTNNFEDYSLENFPFEGRFPRGGTGLYIDKNTKLDAENSDLENSKILYQALFTLTETQASDERLWTYMTHVVFWKYMRNRWPVEKTQENKEIGRITDRYFLRKINIQSLTRNGIARLWWYAHLTYDKSRANPFELTEVLLSKADLTVGLTERALGSNRNILFAVLEFLKENSSISSSEEKTREIYKRLNLVGGVRNLPFLSVEDITEILEKIKITLP